MNSYAKSYNFDHHSIDDRLKGNNTLLCRFCRDFADFSSLFNSRLLKNCNTIGLLGTSSKTRAPQLIFTITKNFLRLGQFRKRAPKYWPAQKSPKNLGEQNVYLENYYNHVKILNLKHKFKCNLLQILFYFLLSIAISNPKKDNFYINKLFVAQKSHHFLSRQKC